MSIITLDEITRDALWRFQKIYAQSEDMGQVLIWNSHKLLPWSDPTLPAPPTEDGTVRVNGLGDSDLEPVRQRIRNAGGERWLC